MENHEEQPETSRSFEKNSVVEEEGERVGEEEEPVYDEDNHVESEMAGNHPPSSHNQTHYNNNTHQQQFHANQHYPPAHQHHQHQQQHHHGGYQPRPSYHHDDDHDNDGPSSPSSSSTLFLGDLSIFCKEEDLRVLFSPYGYIDSIQIKENTDKKQHLCYGFIKFVYHESAELAIQHVNGQIFQGRAIRVGWAANSPNRKRMNQRIRTNDRLRSDLTAQIHVNFISERPMPGMPEAFMVTEESLRQLFSFYGKVVDVTIKKTNFHQVNKTSLLAYLSFNSTFFPSLFFLNLGERNSNRLWICSL